MQERLPEAVQHPVPHRTARDNCPQLRLDAANGALPIATGSDTLTNHVVTTTESGAYCGSANPHVRSHRPTAVALIDHLKGREKALEPFDLTGRRAEWIALASLHGGVFTRSQLSAWFGIDRFKTLRFVQALTRRRLAAEEMVGDLKICRICARGIYRALGAEGIRLRRITSTEVIMRRVLSFDYVIEHPDLPWLPTESEKVAAFEALDMGRSLMPVRVYRGAAGGAALLPARDARGAGLPPRRVRPRRSRLRHLDRAPFVAGPAPEALGGTAATGLVGRGRRGRVRPETA